MQKDIISIVLVLLLFLAVSGFVYKNLYAAVHEITYILNLGILATGSLYVQYINNSGNQEALVTISVGIAFLQFMATVIYHAYVLLREPLKSLKAKAVRRLGGQEDVEITNEPEREDYESIDGYTVIKLTGVLLLFTCHA